MRQRDFAGTRRIAAADQTRGRDRVMRRAKRARAHESHGSIQKAGDAPDRGDLDGLVGGERRKNRRQPSRQHRFPRTRRSDEDQVVSARGRDFERTLRVRLPADVGEVELFFQRDARWRRIDGHGHWFARG